MIAITLVAGVAIAGYAFGLFTTLSSGANVQAVGTATCSGGHCTLKLQNTGGTSATFSSVNIGGLSGTSFNATGVDAGKSVKLGFNYAGTFTASSVTGQVALSTGSTVPFVATVS
ncbi:MAG: hypothetical protein KGI38_12595 [Thaumarchaeota archaeon]|nr:hypothetical protein [Nitrososphaerota archaeon]